MGAVSGEEIAGADQADSILAAFGLNLFHDAIDVALYGVCGQFQPGGSAPEVPAQIKENLQRRFPSLCCPGMESSRFRKPTVEEKHWIVNRIPDSGAVLVFEGLGRPWQQVRAQEFRELLSLPILALGAAFPFREGVFPQAPR